MLAEFVKSIVDLGRQSRDPRVMTHKELPGVVFLVDAYGAIQEHKVPPAKRRHAACDLDAFVAMVGELGATPQVFYGLEHARAYLDAADRREVIELPFDTSSAWTSLCRLPAVFSQRGIVNALRFDLEGHVSTEILSTFRRLEFQRRNDGQRTVEHGRESLGKSVEAKVVQADQIPEEIELRNVRVFRTPGLQGVEVNLRLGVTLDAENARVELAPFPASMEAAKNAIAAQVGEILTKALPEVPVFHGAM